jgi:hypothetical protein
MTVAVLHSMDSKRRAGAALEVLGGFDRPVLSSVEGLSPKAVSR